MNRKTILIIVLISVSICSVQIANAQSVKVSFGIKGGGVTTSANTLSDLHYGGYGGAFLGLRFGKVIGIQGEADYSFQGTYHSLDNLNIKTTQQYLQIPVVLQIWAGRAVIFEVGYQQSILMNSTNTILNEDVENTISPNHKAFKSYGSIIGGVTFNLGKAVFLNLRYTHGITNSHTFNYIGYPISTLQMGIGFRLYNSKRSIYK